jgi:2-amino-4-hydroxy-6-hydroxymethyldihydropteridine diphosphokinase
MAQKRRDRPAGQPVSVVIALGTNLGDRLYNLRRAVQEMSDVVRVVRLSTVHQTVPVDAPAGSPLFLNMAVAGYTAMTAPQLVGSLLEIERRLGRIRRGPRNAPRIIDLDLIVYGAHRVRTIDVTLPHPRARARDFVMLPVGECAPVAARFIARE